MKLGRGGSAPQRSAPVALPERAQTVTLVPLGATSLPARVLESGPDTLLVAIMVPTEPLGPSQLERLVLEFVSPQGRVRLTGAASYEDPRDHELLRIDGPRSIEVLQEREYVRIKSARPVIVYGARGGASVQSFTVDLSGGGFLLGGPDSLKIGHEIQFQIAITPGVPPITGTGKVVRVDNQGRRGIEFCSISEFDRRRLIRFIFECQRAERQRGLEMDDRRG